jgi:tRNA-2-methylthio-N6-dimethylallyladenosine synthase
MEHTFFIKTFGCQMNEYDSLRMENCMLESGFSPVCSEEEAQYIIINTCSVRQHAEDRAVSYAGRFLKNKKVIFTGCMAQSEAGALVKQHPAIFAVIGTSNFEHTAEIIDSGGGVNVSENDEAGKSGIREGRVSAYLAVARGCDNFCSYCIVPYVRGREKSRPKAVILAELEKMALAGTREVTLLGQNVNSYLCPGTGVKFPQLLSEASKIPGLELVRFMTSHPKDLSEELIDAVASNPKCCTHFHLPLQSGSDRVLLEMNRKYTSAGYEAAASKIKAKIKDLYFTSDILVGFPAETEKDFMETAAMVEKMRYDAAYVFKYSVRRGTAAQKLGDAVPEEEKLRRLNYILDLQKKIGKDINAAYLGRGLEVLGLSALPQGQLKASAMNGKKVFVNAAGAEMTGKKFRVRIIAASNQSVTGEVM